MLQKNNKQTKKLLCEPVIKVRRLERWEGENACANFLKNAFLSTSGHRAESYEGNDSDFKECPKR